MTIAPQPRPLSVRIADVRDRFATSTQMWLATGGAAPHLIPVAVVLDDPDLVTATFLRSRTVTNLRSTPRARLAFGSTDDVVMVDASVEFVAVAQVDTVLADRYARVSHDPRVMPGFTYLRFTPLRIQAWNGFHEFDGRTVMRDGSWLLGPVD